MATTFQTTNLIVASGTAFTYAASGDSYWIGQGVTVASGSGAAIAGSSSSSLNLTVHGHVFNGGYSVAIALGGEGNHRVQIGKTGTVATDSPAGYAALFLSGGGSAVVNEGSITATRAIGLLLRDGDNNAINNGTIHGGSNGVFMGLFGGTGDTLVNYGEITAGMDRPEPRFGHGVMTEGDNTTIINHGYIGAVHAFGAGATIGSSAGGGAGSRVENYGTVSSALFWGVDMNFLLSGSASVINYGLISGGAGGIRGGNFGGSVVNSGNIVGDVAFGGGTVSYDGAYGHVQGWIRGGTGNATLSGGDKADWLDSGTGGVNVLEGRGGNDSYVVRNAGDTIVEAAGGGFDSVYSTVNYTLAAGAHVEQMLVLGSAGLSLRGNEFNQIMRGGTGNDTLDGVGGVNEFRGGLGNDSFVVRNAADTIMELAGQGTDTVYAAVSYTLAADVHVEQMRPLTPAATTPLSLTGNSFNQTIIGGAGNDTLDGFGGVNDLRGGLGNDTYIVRSASDTVVELAGQGFDSVYSAVSYTLGAGVHVEELRTISAGATTAISLTGNALDQIIRGNAGNNTIRGGGGTDDLFGGAGNDSFVFSSALGGSNLGRIQDFNVADDTIYLAQTVFSAIALGQLAASAFVIGAAATTAAHRIIYNSGNGDILYDADGSGGGAAIKFASVSSGLGMTNQDFIVF